VATKPSGAQGDEYVKTTPVTLPTVAVPTDRIPTGVSVMPAGSPAPEVLMPKVPPRATPAGKVVARLNVPPLPTANEGGLTTHAPDADGGAVVGAGATDESSALTSQPASESAAEANPKRKTARRPTCFMNPLSTRAFFFARLPPPWVRQPRVPVPI
jgi:hypothetical protein